MRWSKQDRELIEQEIQLYDMGIKAGFITEKIMSYKFPLYESKTPKVYYCIFCPIHLSMSVDTCIACPNYKICNILGMDIQDLWERVCFINKGYFVKHFNLKTVDEEARFRRLMWKKALWLPKEEWLAIYGKEER